MSRLQFIHFDGKQKNVTRQDAINYIERLTNSMYSPDKRLEESLIGEPIAVTYLDENNVTRVMFAIGKEGEKGEGKFVKYHIIDSAKLEEDIAEISGFSSDIKEQLEAEIERAQSAENSLQVELDATQVGAGLNEDGSYEKNVDAEYINDVNSLNAADVKLDTELARVEKARKDVTGQETDVYVPNVSLTTRPIAYIENASSLNDADVKLDEGIQKLDKETVKNIVVNNVEGTVEDNVAKVEIIASDIKIGEYVDYSGEAQHNKQIDNHYTVLDAIKQLDINFNDFAEEEVSERKGIHLVKVTTGLDTNVKEAYDLVNKEGQRVEGSERVLIYKDSSLYRAYLGHMDDYLEDHTSPVVTPGTGDTALCFIYLRMDGTYDLVKINVESYLEENEFKDGLQVNNHEVSVKVDELSENFLTVSPNGIKLEGINDAIDSSVNVEKERAQSAEDSIQAELDTTQVGAGLNEDGTYKRHNEQGETYYIHEATSLDKADVILDRELNRVETGLTQDINNEINRAQTAESEIEDDLNSEVERATNAEASLNDSILFETSRATTREDEIENSLNSEIERATAKENELETNLNNEIQRSTEADQAISESVAYETSRATSAETVLSNKIELEKTERQNADDNLSDRITAEESRAQEAEQGLTTAIERESENRVAAIVEERSSRIAEDEILAALINSTKEKVDNEIIRAQSAETTINSNLTILSGSVTSFSSSTKTILDNIIEEIAEIDSKTITGSEAINAVTTGKNTTVSLLINGSDKVLSQDNSGLRTTLRLSIADDGKTVYLIGKNNEEISSIDTSKFVVDGMLEDVVFNSETKVLTFIFNVDSGKRQIDIPLGALVDIYTVSGGSENYLQIDNFKVGAKVDIPGGLASKEYVDTLENKCVESARTLEQNINNVSNSLEVLSSSTVNLSGSTKTIETDLNNTKIDIEIFKNNATTSANTLNLKIEAETDRAEGVEEELRQAIIQGSTVEGRNAISVDKEDNISIVSLVIDENDKILTQQGSGLKANLKLEYSRNDKEITLKGANNEVLSTIDTNDFVVDGMLDNVTLSGNSLIFTFNTDAGKEDIVIDIEQFSDIYTVSGGSENYLEIDNFQVGAKVDVTNGLASKEYVDSLREDTESSANTLNTKLLELSGGTISADNAIYSALTILESNIILSANTLDNKIIELSGATNASADTLNTKIDELSGSVITLSGDIIEYVNTEINNLSGNVNTEINNLSGDIIEYVNTEINNLSGDVNTEINNLSGDVIEYVNNEITNLSGDTVEYVNTEINNLSGDIIEYISTLSGETGTLVRELSAATIQEVERLDGRIDELSGDTVEYVNTEITNLSGDIIEYISTLSGETGTLVRELSAATIQEVERLDDRIDELSGSVITLSGDVIEYVNNEITNLSGDVYLEVERLDDKIDNIAAKAVSNSDGSINVVTGTAEGTSISVNIKNNEHILANDEDGNGIYTNLNLVKVTTGLSSNVKEKYQLIGTDNTQIGSDIDIYNDSSLYNVVLGHIGDLLQGTTSIDEESESSVIVPTSDTGASEALNFVYLLDDGKYKLAQVNVENFLQESEFKDGLEVNSNHEVSVKIDSTSEPFLTVSSNGVKLSGVQTAIESAYTIVHNEIQGLEDGIQELSGVVIDNEEVTAAALNELDERINNMSASTSDINDRISSLSASVISIQENLAETIYNVVSSILNGTTSEIAIVRDDTNNKITISFDNPYAIGKHDSDSQNDF